MTQETEELLLKTVGEIKGLVEGQGKELAEHTASLTGLASSLNGNGKPGLKQQVAAHEATLDNLKKVLWIVGTPVLAACGGGLVTAVVYLVRMLPH
jgi:hypothetical protein